MIQYMAQKPMKNQEISPLAACKGHRKERPQSGSVVFLILIGVALFAALSFVMTKSFKGTSATLSKEKTQLLATEIIQYSESMKQAVKTLRVNGCSDTQITFEGSHTTVYQNVNAPNNFLCHVFDTRGGGMTFKVFPREAYEQIFANTVSFDANSCLHNVGQGSPSTCTAAKAELLMNVYPLNREVCIALNNALGNGDLNAEPPTVNTSPATLTSNFPFDGVYGPGSTSIIGDVAPAISGKQAGCYRGTSGFSNGFYIFYQALAVR